MKRLNIILNCIPLIMLVGLCIWVGTQYSSLPSEIPGHYNISGQVDSWDKKGTIWITVGCAWFMYFLLLIPTILPEDGMIETMNGAEECTEEGKRIIYHIAMDKLRYINILVAAMFCHITAASLTSVSMGWLFLFLGIMFILIIMMMSEISDVKAKYKKKNKDGKNEKKKG